MGEVQAAEDFEAKRQIGGDQIASLENDVIARRQLVARARSAGQNCKQEAQARSTVKNLCKKTALCSCKKETEDNTAIMKLIMDDYAATLKNENESSVAVIKTIKRNTPVSSRR